MIERITMVAVIVAVVVVSVIGIAQITRGEDVTIKDLMEVYDAGYSAGYNQALLDVAGELMPGTIPDDGELSDPYGDGEIQENDEEEPGSPPEDEGTWEDMYPERSSENLPIPL